MQSHHMLSFKGKLYNHRCLCNTKHNIHTALSFSLYSTFWKAQLPGYQTALLLPLPWTIPDPLNHYKLQTDSFNIGFVCFQSKFKKKLNNQPSSGVFLNFLTKLALCNHFPPLKTSHFHIHLETPSSDFWTQIFVTVVPKIHFPQYGTVLLHCFSVHSVSFSIRKNNFLLTGIYQVLKKK